MARETGVVPWTNPYYDPNNITLQDFMGAGTYASNTGAFDPKKNNVFTTPGTEANMYLGGFGQTGIPIGLSTLLQNLFRQGRTDPAMLNKQIASIGRGTQANQSNLYEELARRGLTGSMAGLGLGSAIGQAGVAQQSQAIAQENQMAEARKREDLNQLFDILINPSLGMAQAYIGANANKSKKPKKSSSLLGAVGSFIGGMAGPFGSYLGGQAGQKIGGS